MNTQTILSKIASLGNEVNIIFDIAGDMSYSKEINKFVSDVLNLNKSLNFIQLHVTIKGNDAVIDVDKIKTLQQENNFIDTVEVAVQDYNQYPTVIITHGFQKTIELSGLRKEIILVSFKSALHFEIPAVK